MIIDSFMYFNEQDVAEIRMNELDSIVDLFVVGIGDLTFRGKPNNNELVIPDHLKHKVLVNKIKLPELATPWQRELALRQRLQERTCASVRNDDDVVIFTDVDEIPHPGTVKNYSDFCHSPSSINMDHYNYNFRYIKPHWECAILVRGKHFYKLDADSIRSFRHNPFFGGWHLSYFGNASKIQEKMKSYSHSEFDLPHYTDIAEIQRRIDNNIDVIDRPNVDVHPRWELPQYVQNNTERFKEYL